MVNVRLWVFVLAAPAVANWALWVGFTQPQQKKRETVQGIGSIQEIKPELESLLKESHKVLTAWEQTSLTKEDDTTAAPAIRRSAEDYRIQIQEIRENRGREAGSERENRMVEIEAMGRFNKLARWMSHLENQAGIEVNSWRFEPQVGSSGACKMTMAATVSLEE